MSLCNIFSLGSKKKMTFRAKEENINLSLSSPYATKKQNITDVKANARSGLVVRTRIRFLYCSIKNQNATFNKHVRGEENCC